MSKGTVAELKATKTKSNKRPDIQLLRAFAVISVVGYHFELPGFTYGFLGVDIFLVVSGYLVGGSLIREMQLSGKIDFKRFFSARIKRLLPAALAAVIFTMALLQITNQLTTREIRHAFWSLLYVQNVNLGIEGSSYLGGDLNPSYFVHYWSLSLEEQFYIIAPILLLIIFKSRLGRKVLPILAVIAIASFAFSMMQTLDGEASAYYSILTRAWQFIMGMLIANYLPTKSLSKKLWVIAALLVLFFIGSVSFFQELAFPAPGALVPSLFSGVFLLAGSSVPFRFPIEPLQKLGVLIGDLSYSMYLIHFPLALLFLKWSSDQEDYNNLILGLIATFFLSIVSKSFIEDPFRFGSPSSKMPTNDALRILFANLLFAAALIALANSLTSQAVNQQSTEDKEMGGVTEDTGTQEDYSSGPAFEVCVGARALFVDGCFDYIYADPIIPPQSANESIPDAYANGCHISQNEPVEYKSCYYGETENFIATIALVGDSHATQWLPGFDEAGKSSSIRIKTYLMSGCSFRSSGNEKCLDFTNWAHENLAESSDEIKKIFISNRISTGIQNNLAPMTAAFNDDLRKLNEHTNEIFLIADTPLGTLDNSDPNLCLIASGPEDCFNLRDDVTFTNPYLASVRETYIGSYVDIEHLFCFEDKCLLSIGGLPVYRDDDHITSEFSKSSDGFWGEIFDPQEE